jgi:hypothetical protein
MYLEGNDLTREQKELFQAETIPPEALIESTVSKSRREGGRKVATLEAGRYTSFVS